MDFFQTPHPLGDSNDLGERPAHREFQSLLWGEYGPLLEILQLLKPCWFQIQIKKFVVIFIIDEDEYVKKNVATLIREIAKHTPEVCYY